MKKLKKILVVVLAISVVLCFGATAFAATDMQQVTVKKEYNLTNAGTTSPEETFTLEQVGNGVVTDGEAQSAPALGTITGATFAAGGAGGETQNITIQLPSYDKVGVYEYTLREVAGTTAGVDYRTSTIKLVVSVVNDENGNIRIAAVHTENANEEKSDTIANTYSAGALNVTKTVTGNLGDKQKDFDFTVIFTKPADKTVNSAISATVAGAAAQDFNPVWGDDGTYRYTFKLKHDQTATFANLPYGVTYEVTEAAAEGYQTTKQNDAGTINSASATAAFTNEKVGQIDTGITLDNLPYIIGVVAVAIVVAFMIARRKRRSSEE